MPDNEDKKARKIEVKEAKAEALNIEVKVLKKNTQIISFQCSGFFDRLGA